jgi:catechol 2,3-dioxygenase-like lactoylglutathione lyase family enzyme
MVRAVGINHVAFEVRDLDEALAWYGRFFDLRMRGRRPTMAWIDLGDQFIALSETAAPARDTHRHVGLVVDDREALRAALRDAGYDVPGSGSLRVHDPSGNQLEIVDYREVQFTKAPAVLRGMEIADIDKTDDARAELAAKGMLDA